MPNPKHYPHRQKVTIQNPIANRTLAQSYAALPARTRFAFSLGICSVAIIGIVVSDLLENKFPAKAQERHV